LRRGSLFAAVAVLIVAIGVGLTQKHNLDVQHEREARLRDAVTSIRHAIGSYRVKHQRNPGSLNDLVTDGELRVIPSDPITHSNTTWKTTVEESVSVDDFQPASAKAAPSMTDVHSGASGRDSTGRPFADY
jgi:general secretion pathway protein G